MQQKIKGPNPKEAMGAQKAPMNACPNTAIAEVQAVMGGGAHKYGLYNFRDTDISAQTYIGAIRRHLVLWEDGQDDDEESGLSHLAHIMACCALAIDAGYTGKLIDDRSKTGVMPDLLKRIAERHTQYCKDNKSAEQRLEESEVIPRLTKEETTALNKRIQEMKGTTGGPWDPPHYPGQVIPMNAPWGEGEYPSYLKERKYGWPPNMGEDPNHDVESN